MEALKALLREMDSVKHSEGRVVSAWSGPLVMRVHHYDMLARI